MEWQPEVIDMKQPSAATPEASVVGTSRTALRRERLEARVNAEQKALMERAAALEGRSLTDFVVGSVQAAAIETIRRYETIVLSARDSEAFAAALASPPSPNERLRAAARRHRELIGA